MVPSKKRDAVSWWVAYCQKQEDQGLNIEESVTDGGLGMKKGIKEAYENVKEQYDIFHMLMKFTKAINIYENKTYALINAEYLCEKKLLKANPKISKEDYETARAKASISILRYDKFQIDILKTIIRCSSIVENINSQIRPYLLLKRVLKGKFLDLLQFYLNIRKYLNSRIKERKGKSPLELLTGKDYGNWLDILGY